MRAIVLVAGFLGLSSPSVIIAQTVTGQAVDSLSGKALGRAVVYFDQYKTDYLSGNDGRFAVERKRPTDTVLVVRRIGYVPTYVIVKFSASASRIDIGTVTLRPIATQLDKIAVETEEIRRYPQLEDFYRRRERQAGFFMTPDEIARASAPKPSRLIERSVKVNVGCNDRGNGRWQRGGPFDCTPQSSRPQGLAGGLSDCQMDLWVDGQPSNLQLDEIPVKEIVALEVYSGPGTTPTAFGDGHCGVVVLWTNAGEGI